MTDFSQKARVPRNTQTLLLNNDWRPLRVIDWHRAICLLMKQVVIEVDFYADFAARDGKGRYYTIPSVLALKKHVHINHNKVSLNKHNMILRDQSECQYCGMHFKAADLTFDHVYPKSRGGKNCFENIVMACKKCNRKKADKTCEESGMFPLSKPTRPTYDEVYLGINPWSSNIPEEWWVHLENLSSFKNIREKQLLV